MSFDFDRIIERRGTHSAKWDSMQSLYGLDPAEGLPMWVADTDFAAPPAVAELLRRQAEHGVYGYYGDDSSLRAAICDFYDRRHGWRPEPGWIATTHGLVAGTAVCINAFTKPGEGIVLFTPVYHAFHKIIRANGRRIVESPLALKDGRYEMDLEALPGLLDDGVKMVVLCSPHNPGGRVWSVEEIRALADFCAAHELTLVSDEIHCDLVFPGATHTVALKAAPEHADRIAVMVASSKTFNIAGAHTGHVIISDPNLKGKFDLAHMAVGASPNSIGVLMAEAAYKGGDEWLDELVPYLDENRKVFDAAIEKIPGLTSMKLESTYLAWVDFSGTGMGREEFTARVQDRAKIATNYGPAFGTGGETFLRFNLGTPRSRVIEACERLAEAFSDLQ